ncbi:MAG: SdrD B-like domain-containing protein, partial [Anaerolineae bacterium]
MNQRRSVTKHKTLSPTNLVRLVTVLLMLGLLFVSIGTVEAQSSLNIEIIAGYNLVVDSNVTATSTYSPAAATVVGRICNDGTTALTGVEAYIGDYGSLTAGTYPSTDSAGFAASHPLYNTGSYAFRHMGGRIGLDDATRYVGDLAIGECRVQYWHFSYPRCENSWDGSQWNWSEPPCSGSPTWGDSVKPEDDLSLSLDVWATADGGTTANASRTMTMRNEISAMANKIQPNPDGRWFNTTADQVQPGDTITSNGILYSLGNVRFGFDNDNDYVPDYNAWLQPIGDPAYDPSCFRLIKTSGVLTVTRGSGNPDLIITFDDQNNPPSNPPQYGGPLYFTNLPSDNTNVRGKVYYTFLALDGPCSTGLTPYQEVASGYDNEKFNGDYGAGIPPVGSLEPAVTIDKSSNPDSVTLGTTWTYNVPFSNGGSAGAGLPLSTGGIPLVISDTVPAGLEYIGGSASADLGVTVRFSTDSGQTWSSTDPGNYVSTAPDNLLIIQWWLDDTLDPAAAGTATFQVRAPAGPTPPTYSGDPIVENCADSRFGNNPAFAEACAITLIEGNNSVGDLVWRDDDNDGVYDPGDGEAGLDNVAVSLYWDKDGDGLLDDGDVLISTMDTYNNGGPGFYTFSNLPDGNYLVQVDTGDADIPNGHR